MTAGDGLNAYQPKDKNRASVQAMAISSTEVVDGTSASAQSTAVTQLTVVRISSLSDCYIEFGTNPTATTSSALFPGGNVEYFKLHTGDKIAVLNGVATISTME